MHEGNRLIFFYFTLKGATIVVECARLFSSLMRSFRAQPLPGKPHIEGKMRRARRAKQEKNKKAVSQRGSSCALMTVIYFSAGRIV